MALTELLETDPPAATLDDAARVAAEVYGVDGVVESLPGERDRNFLLTTDSASFVLKIANPAERPAALDMQQRVLLHIRRWDRKLPVPQPIRTRKQTLVGSSDVGGQAARVTLTTHLPGMPLEEVAGSSELRTHTVELLARLDLALGTFDHPELDRPLAWDLRMLPQLRGRLESLDEPKRRFAETWLRHFDNHVVPRLLRLRTQAIHNDFNPANLLVDPADEGKIAGIVDFGDMTRGSGVGDLAVAAAYQCLGQDDVAGVLVNAAGAYGRHVQLEPSELDLIPDLAMSRLVQSLIISAWRAVLHPDNREYILIHAEPAWKALQQLWDVGLDELRRVVVASRKPRSKKPLTTDAVLRARRRRLSPGLRLTYSTPLHAVSAESVWITDRNGVRHLDAYNNVAQVGHGHPAVVAALTSQAARLNTNTRYLVSEVVEYADRLAELLPDSLDTVFFANSGSEANDLAWRIARTVTGRRGMIVTAHAYHGSTYLTIATSPEELVLENLEPWVATISPPRSGVVSNAEIERAIARLNRAGEQPAAFACDTVFSSDGIYDAMPGYFVEAFAATRRAGGVCIADEVQAGLGRVGERMWGFAADDVAPDIVTLGKPLGNGHPIAAVVTTAAIAREFNKDGYYFSTFAGNPVSAAVGMKVLEVTERERLPQRAEVVGRYLRTGLEKLAESHEMIGEVRGPGLFIGVELVGPDGTPASAVADLVQNQMRERRVLIGRTGPHGNVLKIRPPLVFTEQHSDLLLETLDGVLGAI